MLLVTSNGTGMGHLTRQSAVARALGDRADVVVLSLSSGLPVVLEQGLRGVLAVMALFGWNRIGLTPFERRHVLTQAMGAWHPHVAPLQAAEALAA